MGQRFRQRYTVTAEPGVDWQAFADLWCELGYDYTVETNAEGTTAWIYVATYGRRLEKRNRDAVCLRFPLISKVVPGHKNHPQVFGATTYWRPSDAKRPPATRGNE